MDDDGKSVTKDYRTTDAEKQKKADKIYALYVSQCHEWKGVENHDGILHWWSGDRTCVVRIVCKIVFWKGRCVSCFHCLEL